MEFHEMTTLPESGLFKMLANTQPGSAIDQRVRAELLRRDTERNQRLARAAVSAAWASAISAFGAAVSAAAAAWSLWN